MKSVQNWRIRLTAAAEADFSSILRFTVNNFGLAQARRYAKTLSSAIEALSEGADILGSKERPEVGEGIKTLHVARNGQKGSHFILFRGITLHEIDVLRILHERADLPRHVLEEHH